MRVRHLTDHELQGLLDRRTLSDDSRVPVTVYHKDLEAQEHLDNCSDCQAEMELYRTLFGELEQAPPPELSRGFARKVTFSLPPFRAQRTRTRLKLAFSYGILLLGALVWSLWQINWGGLIGETVRLSLPVWQMIDSGLAVLTASIPWVLADMIVLLPSKTGLLRSIGDAFVSGNASVHLIVFATLLLVMVNTIDRLVLGGLLRRVARDR